MTVMLTSNLGADACLGRRPWTEDSAGKTENPKRRGWKWQAHMCNCQGGPYQPQASWNTGRSSYGTVCAEKSSLETEMPDPWDKINTAEYFLMMHDQRTRCFGFQCMNKSWRFIYMIGLARTRFSESPPLQRLMWSASVPPAASNHYVYHAALSEII